ncbi:ATP phosphoribosyltransferase [Propionibacterium sp. oral taxon 192 str. F0372]|uniref:ATP phosphoribosyltransferase n=1 Tax=Propionibacterium sp. oral taxon 192 TaxID=671222 RepID=UPI00035387DD|nr:ATP phosphoribosyltransferase [Propionibacterium sp. oral taxon 192]EPH00220.1 ATP phosphoribosyltransferase [Propionibacterium sp. oral taxon 192 str. F0372]
MLKIAVPNKGALSEAATTLLREAGYRQRCEQKELVLVDEDNNVEFYYLRPRDIAIYVGEGTLDLGITGRDMLRDSCAAATEIMALGFGRSNFRFAAPGGSSMSLADLDGCRIATSYPGLLSAYLADRGITARLIPLDGAVEVSIRLGVADVIADVVETGTTLRKAGLELFGDPILTSEGILIQRTIGNHEIDAVGLDHLLQRLSGVQVARTYVLLDYDIPENLLEQASALTPGLEAPTVSPLAKPGWVAVRSLVPVRGHQRLMDNLHDLGARGILVTGLSACRL